MLDNMTSAALEHLSELLAQWRAASGGQDDGGPHKGRLAALTFRRLAGLALEQPDAFPSGVSVIEAKAPLPHRLVLRVDGLGVVWLTGAAPQTIFEAIAEACERAASLPPAKRAS